MTPDVVMLTIWTLVYTINALALGAILGGEL